ncbi:LysR family transcriptional regulator [Arthrobacter sp. JCM 19049]|uniref:helix-turn-helix domain-containing protein n=1 Tax=Arthrobacter sp. JCM 19049 TaxID=1460643 RepID=UPI002436C3BC|nr:LysR family transcriptional regulator [Arthrobacter sp. JCM 19049]
MTVADLGHFTRAAEQLHLAQPSLSRQIATLESELGSQLSTAPAATSPSPRPGKRWCRWLPGCWPMPTGSATRCRSWPGCVPAGCGWVPRPRCAFPWSPWCWVSSTGAIRESSCT